MLYVLSWVIPCNELDVSNRPNLTPLSVICCAWRPCRGTFVHSGVDTITNGFTWWTKDNLEPNSFMDLTRALFPVWTK